MQHQIWTGHPAVKFIGVLIYLTARVVTFAMNRSKDCIRYEISLGQRINRCTITLDSIETFASYSKKRHCHFGLNREHSSRSKRSSLIEICYLFIIVQTTSE